MVALAEWLCACLWSKFIWFRLPGVTLLKEDWQSGNAAVLKTVLRKRSIGSIPISSAK